LFDRIVVPDRIGPLVVPDALTGGAVMGDDAGRDAQAQGAPEDGREPYTPPSLTSYGSLPVDTAGINIFPGADMLGYLSI
jgi:hypothetical protein